jgi:hypothetical protein
MQNYVWNLTLRRFTYGAFFLASIINVACIIKRFQLIKPLVPAYTDHWDYIMYGITLSLWTICGPIFGVYLRYNMFTFPMQLLWDIYSIALDLTLNIIFLNVLLKTREFFKVSVIGVENQIEFNQKNTQIQSLYRIIINILVFGKIHFLYCNYYPLNDLFRSCYDCYSHCWCNRSSERSLLFNIG